MGLHASYSLVHCESKLRDHLISLRRHGLSPLKFDDILRFDYKEQRFA